MPSAALAKRSDQNRDRRLAEEEKRRAAEHAARSRRSNPIAQLRAQRAKDDKDREVYERRQAAKAARLKASGLTVAEVAGKMEADVSIVEGYLQAHRAQAKQKRGA